VPDLFVGGWSTHGPAVVRRFALHRITIPRAILPRFSLRAPGLTLVKELRPIKSLLIGGLLTAFLATAFA
jgi:hypothetical protein